MSGSLNGTHLCGAIVGFGTIAEGHWAGYRGMSDVSIVAIVDPTDARRNRARALIAGVRVYDTVGALLMAEVLDFLDICTPPSSHLDIIAEAHRAGIAVLCEKPVVRSEAELRALMEVCAEGDSVVFPCHNYRFAPSIKLLRNVVGDPSFGEVVAFHMRTLRVGHARGVPDWNPDWRRDTAISGGGIIQDHGWHSAYLLLETLGATPTSVSCIMGSLRSDSFPDSEDTALISLAFEGALYATISLSWASNRRETSYEVFGTGGSILVHGDNITHIQPRGDALFPAISNQLVDSQFDDPLHAAWFRELFASFRAASAEPESRGRALREISDTALLVEAAYRSAASGGAADLLSI